MHVGVYDLEVILHFGRVCEQSFVEVETCATIWTLEAIRVAWGLQVELSLFSNCIAIDAKFSDLNTCV